MVSTVNVYPTITRITITDGVGVQIYDLHCLVHEVAATTIHCMRLSPGNYNFICSTYVTASVPMAGR